MATGQAAGGVVFRSALAWQLSRAALATVWALWAASALLLLVRRATGSLGEPLPAGLLLVLGPMLAASAFAFHTVAAPRLRATRPAARYAVALAPALVLLLWVAALWLPGTSAIGLVALVGVLVGEEVWSWQRRVVRGTTPARPELVVPVSPAPAREPDGVLAAGANALDPPAFDIDGATQWMVRRRDAEGLETIEGWLRVPLAENQRHATAHVAICPPFERTPQCYAEISDGPPGQAHPAQVLAYGVRFEVKLDQAVTAASELLLEFSIVQPLAPPGD